MDTRKMGICGEKEMLRKSRGISLVFSGEGSQARRILRPMNDPLTGEHLSNNGVSTPTCLSKRFEECT